MFSAIYLTTQHLIDMHLTTKTKVRHRLEKFNISAHWVEARVRNRAAFWRLTQQALRVVVKSLAYP